MDSDSRSVQQPSKIGQLVARWGLSFGTALFALAWALTYLSFPFGRDQGIFAWVGEVITRGGLPYRDAWDVKGPATHLLFAFSHWIFGRTQWGIRLLDLGSLAVTTGLIWHIAGKVGCRNFRWLAPAAFLLWYASLGYWDTAQPDGWATFLLGVAVALMLAEGESTAIGRGFLSGLAIGVAALFKPFYSTFVLLVLAAEVRPKQEPLRNWISTSMAILSGALLPAVVVLIWFAFAGGIDSLIDVQWYYNRLVHLSAVSPGLRGSVNGTFAFFTQRQVALAAAVLGISWLGWRSRRTGFLVVGWLALAFAWVLLQRKFYIYHWIPLFPPLAILAARGLDAMCIGEDDGHSPRLKDGRWSALFAAILAVTIMGFAIKAPIEQVGRWSLRVTGMRSWDSYYEKFGNYGAGDYSYWASSQVARYLREESEPEETVLIWGIETVVHYLGEREPPTRFGFNHPFTVGPPHLTAKYRRELMRDLHEDKPSWIVLVDNDTQRIQPRTSMEHYLAFPELRTFVEDHYCRETVIEDFTMLRRCR